MINLSLKMKSWVVGISVCLGVFGLAIPADAAVKDYTTVGNVTYTAPSNGVYTFELWGAQGAGNSSTTGRGGYVKGTKTLKKGDIVTMVVGGSGSVGSGTGKNAGGGYTKAYLNGSTTNELLATAAGGGGGPSGGDGGAGTGVGGSSVGSGEGTAGTLGGGGGSSPDYSYSSGYYQSTGYYQDTGYYKETTTTVGTDKYVCVKPPGTVTQVQNCSWTTGPPYTTSTSRTWVSTGQQWVSTGQQWVSTGSSYTSGNPGMGGSNANGSLSLDGYASQNGIRVGNGMVRITTPGQAPTLTVNYSGSGSLWTNQDQTITANAVANLEDVEGIQGPDGVWKNVTDLAYAITANGTYTFNARSVSGDVSTKTVTVSNIDKVLPTGIVVGTKNPDSSMTLTLSGVSDALSGVLEIEKPDGTKVSGVTTTTFIARADGVYTFKVVDRAGNVKNVPITVTGVDIVPPTGILTQSPLVGWTTGKVTLTLSGIVDLGGAGYKETVKPDGTKTTATSVTYDVTSNGTYTFEMFDNVGNKGTRTIVVSNLDNTVPNVPTISLSNTGWSKSGVTVSLVSNGDPLNGSGVDRMEYRINGGAWKAYTVSESIPVSYVGDVTVEARAIDRVGLISPLTQVATKIDNTLPVIRDMSITDVNGDNVLRVVADDTLSGLSTSAYQFYKKEVGSDADFVKVTPTWTNDTTVVVPKDKGNTKYLYRVDVRDVAGNVTTSGVTTFVTPVELSYSGVRKSEASNTVAFDLTKPLRVSDEVTVEITRTNNVIGRLANGTTYLDKGLDYERSYEYELIAYTDEGGKRVSSSPIKLSVAVGVATLDGDADKNAYTTPFSNSFKVKGTNLLKSGGEIAVSLWDGSNKIGGNGKGLKTLLSTASNGWEVSGEHVGNAPKTYMVRMEVVGQELIHNKKMDVTVSKKPVKTLRVDTKKYNIYK